MKSVSLDELKEKSKEFFQKNPALEKVFAFQDENIFLQNKEASAKNYSRSSNQRMFTIERQEVMEEAKKEDELNDNPDLKDEGKTGKTAPAKKAK